MSISHKMKRFSEKSSWIRKMFEEGAKLKAKYGDENVFDFSLGNPDLPPPDKFYETIIKIVDNKSKGAHSYMPNGGYPWVREHIATTISIEHNIPINHGDMIMTCGAAGALNIVMKAILNPNDEVILLAPYFVEYQFYIDNHGGKNKVVNTDNNFNLDLDAISKAITDKTKAIIINSPNNPTGQIYSQESLNKLGEILQDVQDKTGNTIYLISDEPYRKIVFDNHKVASVFQAWQNSMILTSYSKDLSIPGERIGYLALHPEIKDKSELLNSLTLANRILGFVNAPALMQRVVADLQDVTVDTSVYEERRKIFCDILTNAGYDFTPPMGAFYIFPKSPIKDDVKFISILQNEKILAVPGQGFGAPGYFRLAFCVENDVIERSAEGFIRAFNNI